MTLCDDLTIIFMYRSSTLLRLNVRKYQSWKIVSIFNGHNFKIFFNLGTKIWCEKKKQNVLILALNRVKIFTCLALWQFPTSEESWHWDINNGSTGLKAYCDTSLIIDSRLKKYLNPFMDLKFQPLFNFRFPTFQTILDSSNLTVLKPPASLPERAKNPWW